jgi:outer membrane protein assembly factor BamB
MTSRCAMLLGNAARSPEPVRCAAPLSEAWHAEVASRYRGVYPAVLAWDGRVFFVQRSGRESHLVALETATQRIGWRYPWAMQPRAIHDGAILAWVDDREAHLIDAETGRPRRTLACLRPDDAIVVGDRLFGCGEDDEYGGHRVYAIDLRSGRRLWSGALDVVVQRTTPTLCASAEAVFYGTRDGAVVACDLETGRERWRWRDPTLGYEGTNGFVPYATRGAPALHDGGLLVAVGPRLVKLRAEDGALLWSVPGGAGGVYQGRYYLVDERYQILDGATGATIASWDLRARLPKTLSASIDASSSIAVSDTHLFVGSREGRLFAFKRETGEYVSHHQPTSSSAIEGPITIVDGRLYYENLLVLYCLVAKA